VVAVDLYLAWQIKDEILASCIFIVLQYFLDEPVNVGLQKLHAIDHTSIGAQLKFLHYIIKSYQIVNVNSALKIFIMKVLLLCIPYSHSLDQD
jgi:hypothetical protein